MAVILLIRSVLEQFGSHSSESSSEGFSKEFPFSAGSFSDTNSDWRLQILSWYFEKPGVPNACLWNL